MLPDPKLLIGLLFPFAFIFVVLFIMSLSQKMLNYRANGTAENIPQEIKSALTASPYFHMLDHSEKKKYRGKFGLLGLVVYVIILIACIFIIYRESGTFSITQGLLISSPFALIVLLLVIRDMLRISPGKEIYCVKAFCTGYVPGRQAAYSFVYYNFFQGCYAGSCVKKTISMRKSNITPGNFCELIVTPGKKRMRVIDVA